MLSEFVILRRFSGVIKNKTALGVMNAFNQLSCG